MYVLTCIIIHVLLFIGGDNMLVTVAGKVTACEVLQKNDKVYTKLLLLQEGQRKQVLVRIDGRREYGLFEDVEFTGRLVSWKTREGAIEHMVLADAS